LRILHLGKYYPPAPGGIESHVQTLARGQAELGCLVSVLCVSHADRFGNDITHARLRKTVSNEDKDGAVHVERVGRWFGVSRLEVCPSLPWRIRQLTAQADIVHLHTPNPLMLAGWWLAGNRKVPMVVTHHSDVIKQRLLRYAVAPFESRVYSKAKRIFSDSPTYGQGSPALQRHEDKVSILPLGIDLQPFEITDTDFCPNADTLKATPSCPLWLMVGRMTYYKGYHIALEALARVPGTLVIVGNGPLEAELKGQAERLGVGERIVWKSHASPKELIALYHSATALWFPSVARSEGFGLVQVEAMAAGCPVINTAIPASGVSWVSQHEVSGLTVPVGDANAFAAAANRIAGENGLRAKLSQGARERAEKKFDARVMAKRSLEMYEATGL
jgi:glycosyltransferase involved in cell wall biosynthesis